MMDNMKQIAEVIQKLLNATGPSDELDREIAQCAKWGRPCPDWFKQFEVLPFTASIDAAELLVPVGWRAEVKDLLDSPKPNQNSLAFVWPDGDAYSNIGVGANKAIALCIAALRAMAE